MFECRCFCTSDASSSCSLPLWPEVHGTRFHHHRLDEQHHKKQQRRRITRQQEAVIAAKLRQALPMELPHPTKDSVAHPGTSRDRTSHGYLTEQRDCESMPTLAPSGYNLKGTITLAPSRYNVTGTIHCDVSSQGRPSPTPALRSSAPPLSFPPVQQNHLQHFHHSCDRKPVVPSALQMQGSHPASFPGMRYSSRRSWHRPGLQFFESIPSRALVSVACTLVFLGADEAKRVLIRSKYLSMPLSQV